MEATAGVGAAAQARPQLTNPPGVIISQLDQHTKNHFIDQVASWRQLLLLLSQAYPESTHASYGKAADCPHSEFDL